MGTRYQKGDLVTFDFKPDPVFRVEEIKQPESDSPTYILTERNKPKGPIHIANAAELKKYRDHSYETPEKLGEQTKEVSYERIQTVANPDILESLPKGFGVWIIEYYDKHQGYQPFNWATPYKDPEKAAEELRKHDRNRSGTSFRAVKVDEEAVQK